MKVNRESAEREALKALKSGLRTRQEQQILEERLGDHGTLFSGRIERHMLRSYSHGLARCLQALAQQACTDSAGEQAAILCCAGNPQDGTDRSYSQLRLRVSMVQQTWPLGSELNTLLDDYRMQGVRGRALLESLAAMAVRLSPSFERRLLWIQALHLQGRYQDADGQMVRILSGAHSPGVRGRAWALQSSLFRARGWMDRAHAASRAAVACDNQMALGWANWLLTSCLVEDREDLLVAGQGLISQPIRDRYRFEAFRQTHGGLYKHRPLSADL
ncbi:MAG: hypothetical protein P1V35_03545, partial [Planctomycetota bacterium]|nr:hypothetical protein [Planctomycetota bacterium]